MPRSLLTMCLATVLPLAALAVDGAGPTPARSVLNGPQQMTASPSGQSALKQERQTLLSLSIEQLLALAETGDRSAQMVLAERFANEAESLAAYPQVANSAMADAAYWSNLAARRGYPGASTTDNAFPIFPLRAHR